MLRIHLLITAPRNHTISSNKKKELKREKERMILRNSVQRLHNNPHDMHTGNYQFPFFKVPQNTNYNWFFNGYSIFISKVIKPIILNAKLLYLSSNILFNNEIYLEFIAGINISNVVSNFYGRNAVISRAHADEYTDKKTISKS